MPFTLEGNTMTITLWWLHFGHPCGCSDPNDWLSWLCGSAGRQRWCSRRLHCSVKNFFMCSWCCLWCDLAFHSSSLWIIKKKLFFWGWTGSLACWGRKVKVKIVIFDIDVYLLILIQKSDFTCRLKKYDYFFFIILFLFCFFVTLSCYHLSHKTAIKMVADPLNG